MSKNSSKRKFLSGKAINPAPVPKNASVQLMVDQYFQAYNAGRLREACHLFADEMLDPDVTVGMSITGALTPAGLGGSCIVPLIKSGFVDWIVSIAQGGCHSHL
jgi:deoxyhypusine synthase